MFFGDYEEYLDDDDDLYDAYDSDDHVRYSDDSDFSYYGSPRCAFAENIEHPLLKEEEKETPPRNPLSLLDLAAIVVAKHNDCEQLEQCQQPLDEALLKKVAFHAFPKDERQVKAHVLICDRGGTDWLRGQRLLKDGEVEMTQVGFSATAYVSLWKDYHDDENKRIRVSLTFEKQCLLSSHCSHDSCSAGDWCQHVIAAVLFHIKNPEKVKLYAPLMDSLSLLSRSQLQKLLQYAVNEDPTFMLSIFKHFDAVRDGNSALNSVEGAPDPTFGGSCLKTNWQKSLQKMKTNLECKLNDVLENYRSHQTDGERTCENSHPDNGEAQIRSGLTSFLEQVSEFYRVGYPDQALSILETILETAIKKMHRAPSGVLCSRSQQLHQQLVQFVTALLLHPSLQSEHKAEIISMVEKLVESPAAMKQPAHELNRVNWACLPSLLAIPGCQSPDLQNKLLGEVLCVRQFPDWPDGLKDLLLGNVSIEASTYQEHPCVMMARFESFRLIKHEDYTEEHQSRLARLILLQLAGSAIEKSLIGMLLAKRGYDCQKVMDIIRRCGMSNILLEISVKDSPSKNEGQNNAGTDEEVVICSDDVELSKTEFAFSMMILCEFLTKSAVVRCLSSGERQDLVGFCLLALEASRFRLTAGAEASKAEQRKLVSLEQHLQHYILGCIPDSKAIMNLFLDAFNGIGVSVYEPDYPLVLVSTIVYVAGRDTEVKSQHREEVLNLCAVVMMMCSSETVTTLTPTPVGSDRVEGLLTDLSINKLSDRITTYSCTYKNFTWHQFYVCFKIFLELLNVADRQNEQAIKVMHHMTSVVTPDLAATVAVQLWNLVRSNSSMPFKLAEGLLCLLLKCAVNHNHYNDEPFYKRRIDPPNNYHTSVCMSLINTVGTASLEHLVGSWQVSVEPSEMGMILLQFMKDMHADHPRKADFITLVHEYLGVKHNSNRHMVSHVIELMKFFEYGGENYTKAVSIISQNAASFPQNILFDIACKNIKQKIDLKVHRGANKNETVSEETMRILEAYLKKMTEVPTKKLNWLCKLFCETTDNSMRFASMFDGCKKPDILRHVLSYFEKTDPKLLKEKPALIDSFLVISKTYFSLVHDTLNAEDDKHFAAEVTRVRTFISKMGTDTHVTIFDMHIKDIQDEARRTAIVRSAVMNRLRHGDRWDLF